MSQVDDEYREFERWKRSQKKSGGFNIITFLIAIILIVASVVLGQDVLSTLARNASSVRVPSGITQVGRSITKAMQETGGGDPCAGGVNDGVECINGVHVAGTREAYTHIVPGPRPSQAFADACMKAGYTPASSNRLPDGSSSARCNILNTSEVAAKEICDRLSGHLKRVEHIVRPGDQPEFYDCYEE